MAPAAAIAQQGTLPLKFSELRELLLKNNPSLYYQKQAIKQEEAELLNTKAFSNPNISLSELNFWSSEKMKDLPPLWNGLSAPKQFSIDLEQNLYTAGKRKKRIRLQQSAIKAEEIKHTILTRESELFLKTLYHKLYRVNKEKQSFGNLNEQIQKLNESYQDPKLAKAISRVDVLRINAEAKQVNRELTQIQLDSIEVLKELSTLLDTTISAVDLNPPTLLQNLSSTHSNSGQFDSYHPLKELFDINQQSAQESYSISKAERIPDMELQLQYDRAGGVFDDYLGVGVSIDLPVFNRNKGSIQKAKIRQETLAREIEIEKGQHKKRVDKLNKQIAKQHSVLEDYSEEFFLELDETLLTHISNLKAGNISLLVLMDYLNFYQETIQEHFELLESYWNNIALLEYETGMNYLSYEK